MQSTTGKSSTLQTVEEESFDLKSIILSYIKFWPWFILSVFTFFWAGWMYLQFQTPVYQSSAKVLVTDDKNGKLAGELDIFSDLGINSSNSNLYNELEILRSRSIIESVIKELNLCIDICMEANFPSGNKLYYKNSPINIVFPKNHDNSFEHSFTFEIVSDSNNKLYITETYYENGSTYKNDLGTFKFGERITTHSGPVILEQTTFWNNECQNKQFKISISSLQKKITDLQTKLSVETLNKDASVLKIGIKGAISAQNNDIIDYLIKQHEFNAIEEKNLITRNTSSFIAERMNVIEKELNVVENMGESFKMENQLIDVVSDAELYMSKEESLSKAILETNIQLNLARYMLDFLNDSDKQGKLLPVNMGIENESLSDMLSEYNKLVLEQNNLLHNSSEKNPAVSRLQDQINSMRTSIKDGLSNTCKSLDLKLGSLEKESINVESKISDIPEYERQYRSIMRQQKIKETLYIYLLEKREENEIAMASTIGSIKIIDSAFADSVPISPKSKIIYLGAIIAGLFFPISILYVWNIFDNKIRTIEDLENLDVPVAGIVPLIKGQEYLIDNQEIVDTFQMLCTNINFLLSGKTNKDNEENTGKTIFVTSTIPEEGKTFTSMNLANNLTMNKKKVLIMGLDLRAPKIAEYLEIKNKQGVTDYIIDENIKINDLIIPSNDNPHLSYLISGKIPPNPVEILLNPRLENLFKQLKKQYDYIVVDTPPVGMVIDTISTINHADLILYIIRADFIDKKMLEIPEKMIKDNRAKSIATVLNFSKLTYGQYNKYGYGYGYGYGNKNKKQKSIFSFLKS